MLQTLVSSTGRYEALVTLSGSIVLPSLHALSQIIYLWADFLHGIQARSTGELESFSVTLIAIGHICFLYNVCSGERLY